MMNILDESHLNWLYKILLLKYAFSLHFVIFYCDQIEQQDHQIMDLENDLSYYHETVMKLLNIVTNLGRQIRRPIPPHKG